MREPNSVSFESSATHIQIPGDVAACAGLCHVSGHVCCSPPLAMSYANSLQEEKTSLLCGTFLVFSY